MYDGPQRILDGKLGKKIVDSHSPSRNAGLCIRHFAAPEYDRATRIA
jgi:hypothetical protein